jgi:predicted Zn-dependent peptidase
MTVLGELARQARNVTAPLRSVFNDHVRHTTLSNGLNLLSQRRAKNSNMIDFALRINVGANDDPAGKEGMAHLFEHTFFRDGLLDDFEDRAGSINARTTSEDIIISGFLENTPENVEFLTSTLGEMLTRPVDPSVYERQLNRVRNEIGMRDDNPIQTVSTLNQKRITGKNILGTSESISRISIEDLNDFKEKWIKGAAMTFAVTGIYNHSDIHKTSARNLGTIPSGSLPQQSQVPMTPQEVRIAADHLNQVYFNVSYPFQDLDVHDKKVAFLALNYLRDRIKNDVVMEKGLVYDTHPESILDIKGNGAFSVAGNIIPEDGDKILDEIADVLGKAAVSVDPMRLKKVQMRAVENIPGTRRDGFSDHSADKIVIEFAHLGRVEKNADLIEDMNSITPQEVSAFIKKLTESDPSLITYGRADEIQSVSYFANAVHRSHEKYKALSEKGVHLVST